MDPLEVTILRCGAFAAYAASAGRPIRAMNPDSRDLAALLAWNGQERREAP